MLDCKACGGIGGGRKEIVQDLNEEDDGVVIQVHFYRDGNAWMSCRGVVDGVSVDNCG